MNLMIRLLLAALVTTTIVACDKKKSGGGGGEPGVPVAGPPMAGPVGPGGSGGQYCDPRTGQCYGYNNNNNYCNNAATGGAGGSFGGGFGGGGSGYHYMNFRCLDAANMEVPSYLCQQSQNYSYSQNCSYYGGYNPTFGNQPQPNACNPGDMPVYFPATGATMCMEMAYYNSYNNNYSYGQPMYYGGAVLACSPNYGGYPVNGCSCNTFGGNLGWAWGGASIGFCYQ